MAHIQSPPPKRPSRGTRIFICGIRAIRGLILSVACFATAASGAESYRVYSVEEFVQKGQYIAGVPITVEGRVAIIAGGEIRFRNCDIRFKPLKATLKIPDRSKNLRVVGRVMRDAGSDRAETIFSVEEAEATVEDPQALANRLGKIRRTAPAEEWYAAARWGEQRAKFYKDDNLQAQAEKAYARGFDLERQQVKDRNPDILLELAKRVEERQLPDAIRASLIHEYCVRLWEKLRKASVPPGRQDWEKLATAIAERLPKCKDPLTVVDEKLKRNYLITPVSEYDNADTATRLEMHRFLYVDIQEQIVLPQLAPDGANGFEVAAMIDATIPELHAKAEKMREAVLDKRAAEVNKMSRGEVSELAKAYRDRQDEKAAVQVLESWLFLKRRNLPPNDVEAGLDLANDYRTLLKQDDVADRLLIELSQRHPGAAEIRALLTSRGYRVYDNRWMTEAEYAARPERRREVALAEGRIEPGMTATEVRQAKGVPQSLARALSRGRLTEVWTYRQADSTRIAVYLSRDKLHTGDPQVVRVLVLAPQTP